MKQMNKKKEVDSKSKESNNNNIGKKMVKRVEYKGIQIIELKEEEYESEKQ